MRAASIFVMVLAGAAAIAQTAHKPAVPTTATVAASDSTNVPVLTDSKPPKGRRDPFVSPLVMVEGGPSGPPCNVGKKCLAVEQIELKGVVASQAGMIALVVNSSNRAYFLRENDALFNGVVEHITRDSIVFRQNVYDTLGRLKGTREIVRKIAAPAV